MAFDEGEFQKWARGLPWFGEFRERYGEEPNLNDPLYDYRAAYVAGVEPQRYGYDGGSYHWPSEFKGEGHPTMWMEKFMVETGMDPNEVGIDRIEGERLVRALQGGKGVEEDAWATGIPSSVDFSDMPKLMGMFGEGGYGLAKDMLGYTASKGLMEAIGSGKPMAPVLAGLEFLAAVPGPQEALMSKLGPLVMQGLQYGKVMPRELWETAGTYVGKKSALWKSVPQVGEVPGTAQKVKLDPNDARFYGEGELTYTGQPSRTTGPIEVIHTEDGQLLVEDGWHRIQDAIKRGDKQIEANVYFEGQPETYPQGAFSNLYDQTAMLEVSDAASAIKSDALTQMKQASKYVGMGDLVTDSDIRAMRGLKDSWKLGEVFDHPELYKGYPELRDVQVTLKPGSGAAFTPQGGIELGTEVIGSKETLLHEIQHAIQEREGWARGGSPENMFQLMVNKANRIDELNLAAEMQDRVGGFTNKNAEGPFSDIVMTAWDDKKGKWLSSDELRKEASRLKSEA